MWRRWLLAWEEEKVRECSAFLSNIVLQDHTNDNWKWLLNPIQHYYVHRVYQFLASADEPTYRHHISNVWHRQVPLKVSLFGWRLLRNRLPTKDNLLRRQVIASKNTLCTSGCGSQETGDHLFLGCASLGRV